MLAIIGGTGLSQIEGFKSAGFKRVATPFSEKRVAVELLQQGSQIIAFLPRHGKNHVIPPHKINYRANIWALHQIGITNIIAINAVGGIHPESGPGSFVLPDQIIDYTYSRAGTFFEESLEFVTHTDFTEPFSHELRTMLDNAFQLANQEAEGSKRLLDKGVYGVMQGPRLETAAEIRRLQQDGCDIVGMTGMPEAALARELKLNYAMLALSVNWAAGIGESEILMSEIEANVKVGMDFVLAVVKKLINQY
ncbi:MAG: S-methyl-5'-thioinosine phosphorylase [Gammaproteobacteria bacterium]|nr:S-methyl-5'-thioinosine phosphorylase [Gammaproteobacteria bacterium]MDD9896467.1 S-methyl-5'-thioinosine phosphorylase [Gammaproteobacteria bacterium]MDD9959655.1 S-methyl-5'-thioinosine phosphorylase [Gammaproteobacteria bacterium]